MQPTTKKDPFIYKHEGHSIYLGRENNNTWSFVVADKNGCQAFDGEGFKDKPTAINNAKIQIDTSLTNYQENRYKSPFK